MREIKFRVWDKDNKRMIESYEPEEQGKREYYPFCFCIGFSHWNKNQLELMQYTGLKDKNGKEIYEGDIAILGDGGKVYRKGEVKFGEGLQGEPADWEGPFWGWVIGDTEPLIDAFWQLEIIGNIYQNPELLK